MAFSYSRLETSKYGCTEADELCGLEQTNQNDREDDGLVGYSLNFAQPKDSLVVQVRRSCDKMGRKLFAALNFVLKIAFGRWPMALIILICFISLIVGLSVIAVTGRYHEFRRDISLDSFMVPDIKVSSEYAAFNAAKEQGDSNSYYFQEFLTTDTCTGNGIGSPLRKSQSRLKRSLSSYESDFQTSLSGTLDLVYVAKHGDNIFTGECLQEIHEIEIALMKHKNYDKHCYISSIFSNDAALRKYGNCTPPNSLIDFFYSHENIPDGQNDRRVYTINDTLRYLRSKEYFFKYVSYDFNKKKRSNILRAQILFGKPLKGIPASDKSGQKEEFKRFVTTYIETLEELNNNNQVHVLYGGGDLFDYLVDNALLSDIHLAAISLGLIVLLLLILTFSLWLSFMAVLTILSSVAFAYFFYRVVFGFQYMGILNGVSLFVIIGIGVDDIFVFINTFRQAVDNNDLGNRIVHTIYVAGKATFFTSFTTAAAFGANALSPIPAIHEFGVFMACLVAGCWVCVLFIMAPSLTLWHAGIERCESAMCTQVLSAIGVRRSERLALPDDIRRFLSGVSNNESPESIPLTSTNDDDDDDEPLLVLDDESSSTQTVSARDSIGFRLQSILYYFVAEPVVIARVVIFVIYVVILIGSAVLVSKLQVSTEQPKFFKADSNLQRWLDLPDVSVKMSSNMINDIKTLQKVGISGTPAPTPTPTGRPGHTQPTRPAKTGKPRTRRPTKPTTKTLPTTRFRLPTTRLQTTKRTKTTRTEKTATTRTTVTQHSTEEEEPTSTRAPAETRQTPQTRAYTTTDIPRWVTTSASNVSRTSCPYQCTNGKCNETTHKCDCYLSYIGDTCSQYCPVKTMTGECCSIPFTHEGKSHYGCLIDSRTQKPWCSLTHDYDRDGKKEECNQTVADRCAVRTETANKTCCQFPYMYDMTEYYSCIKRTGRKGLYCSLQSQITSEEDLVKCVEEEEDPVQPSLCPKDKCTPAKAPPNEATAVVYLVFGIKRIDKTSVDLRHVLKETQGKVVYDKVFSKDISCDMKRMINAACRICKAFAKNQDLVTPGGTECFPENVRVFLEERFSDCTDLPTKTYKKIKSISVLKHDPEQQFRVQWFAMAFSSTTSTLSSYSSQRKDYEKWEKHLKDTLSKDDIPDSLKQAFQTSETWVRMFSGIIVVTSAVYGIVVSLLLCLAAVVIFTGHALLFLILFMTILGVLLKVTAIFYLTGWQLGGVEAISLSILVGTSVDYCFHLVEGFILAGNAVNPTWNVMTTRHWRTKAAMSHIGMSIISSAITTILAAIPLCFAQIQLFAKFGLIVTINTAISLLYTITVTMAMLSIFGPSRFRASFRASIKGLVAVLTIAGVVTLVLYLVSTKGGYCITSPSGSSLFDC